VKLGKREIAKLRIAPNLLFSLTFLNAIFARFSECDQFVKRPEVRKLFTRKRQWNVFGSREIRLACPPISGRDAPVAEFRDEA